VRTGLICLALLAAPALAAAQEAPPPKADAKPAPAKPKAKAKPEASGHTVGEVVVTGQSSGTEIGIDRKSYSVGKDLQAQSGSIADALRNLPSVDVDLQGNVSLRGDPNVTILIDGKPSSLFQGDNKGQALQSLPAGQIERVEVITNPSAEFRAEGTGGVINLITKKSRGVGKTGSVKLNAGPRGRINGGVTGGYNSKRLAVTADVNVRRDTQRQDQSEQRQALDPSAGGFDQIDQVSSSHLLLQMAGGHASLDYDLTPKTRIGVESHGNYVDFNVGGPSHFTQTDPAGLLFSDFDRDFDVHQKRAAVEGAANLRHEFDAAGRLLTASLTGEVINDNRVRSGATETFTPPDVAPEADQQRLNYHLRKSELKADYVRPMDGGATFKAGVDLEYDDNAYRNRGFSGPPGALAPDAALTNLFLFKQTLSQAYVTYERPIGDLTVLAGLRVEDTRIRLDQATLGQQDENDYTKLFPSLHLAWKLSEAQQLTASYSHRIERPNPLQFNAFPLLLDPLNLRAGNPRLKPQETHSYELGWQDRDGATTRSATFYYRENFNGFADVIAPLADGRFLTTSANVAKSRSAGLELVASGRIVKGLTYNLSANAFWSEIGPQPLGIAQTRSAFTGFGRGSLNWQVTPDDLVQVNAFFNGRRLTPQGSFEPTGALNLGYRHKLNDQLAVVVTAQDVLRTFRFRQVIDTPTLKSRLNAMIDTPVVMAGFTWTFAGQPKKGEPAFDFGGGAPASPQ
jgi:outer membrane receptor protein involved in Fe transport